MPRQTRKRKRGIGGGQTDARRAEDWRLRERSASKAQRDKLAVFRRSVKAYPNEPTKWIMNNARKKNPTKAQKREKTRKASVARRVALSLAKYLKQVNPGMKTVGAKVQKLKGGVLKITPIKANAAGGRWRVVLSTGHRAGMSRSASEGKGWIARVVRPDGSERTVGAYDTKAQALKAGRHIMALERS